MRNVVCVGLSIFLSFRYHLGSMNSLQITGTAVQQCACVEGEKGGRGRQIETQREAHREKLPV